MLKIFFTSFLFALSLSACGVSMSVSDTQKMIGKNDLVVVKPQGENLPKNLQPLIDAFGWMSTMGCTATHIGNGLVLSAGHCFDSAEAAQSICHDTKIQFGFRKDVAPYLETTCVEIIAMELTIQKDFALFRVAAIPRAKVDVDLDTTPALNTAVTIFGHPNDRPLEWSQTCRVAKSRLFLDFNADFSHQCDTEPVSSGSVVISKASLKIIGIHNGGIEPWNYGTLVSTTPKLVDALRKELATTTLLLADVAPTTHP